MAFASIGSFHLQLSAIVLLVPSLDVPKTLRHIAQWLANIIHLDLPSLAAPECQGSFRAEEITIGKLVLTNAVFALVLAALWLFGRCTGRCNHARNAIVATCECHVVSFTPSVLQCVFDP